MCGEWQLSETKSGLRIHIPSRRKNICRAALPYCATKYKTYILQLSKMLALRQMRQGEILRQESIHLPLLSPEYRYMFYSSPTLLLRCVTEELGSDWLRKQMESKSKPESVWVMIDRLWAGRDEAGTKIMHMERLGELRVRHKLTWKVSWDLHLRLQEQTHVCPPMHTHISVPIAFSWTGVTMRSWTALCGKAERWVLLLLFGGTTQDSFQVCPHPWNRSSIHLYHFLTWNKVCINECVWGAKRGQNTACKDGLWWLKMFPLTFYEYSLHWAKAEYFNSCEMCSKLTQDLCQRNSKLDPLRQSQQAPSKLKLKSFVQQTKSHWSVAVKPASLILSK